jgi:hypothetical protein
MKKIVIAIHGLGNKPPKELLKIWWQRAIYEGIKSIGHPEISFKFELAYWANFFYPELLNPKSTKKRDRLYIDDPYTPADNVPKAELDLSRQKLLDYINKQLNKLFLNDDMSINYSSISDFIIHHLFSELEGYYSKKCLDEKRVERPAKDILRDQLVTLLKKYRKRKILLIAHSMGTIIAYDVLTQCVPDIKIDTFITIGSPLGIPIIISKIIYEQRKFSGENITRVKCPENIKRGWYNFSDLRDKVAIYYCLASNFEKNTNNVAVIDKIVYNDFSGNPHKSYGYLRSPEVAEIIHQFLIHDKSKFTLWINKKVKKMINKIYGADYEP